MDSSHSYNTVVIITLVALLCLSFFFSSCEMAFSAVNRIKLKNMAQKSKRARLVLKMLEMYDKLLSTVLIGNNIVNITASALATALFINLFGAKGVSIASVVVTLLVLIFGDISPKALAKENPETTALRNAPFLRFFTVILTPINLIMSAWKKFLMLLFPVKGDRSTTEDELLTFVEEVRQEGGINIHEEHMIRQVIGFDDQKVSDIFTPRVDVIAVSDTASVEEIDRKFAETGFSRLPVFQDSIDNIKGIILLKDFHHEVVKGLKTAAEIIKPVVFVTKTIKIRKLLKTLQEKHAHLAVVVDEHGGTLGIVTIEDIVEELVGEIWDEHDKIIESVKKISGRCFRVLGNVNFIDMLEAISKQIQRDKEKPQEEQPDDNDNENDSIPDTTIANWIMENLGRLPRVNEVLTWPGSKLNLSIKVLKVIKQRVMEVEVTVTD